MVNELKRQIQLEAFEALKANGFNGAVILPTGVGKTWVLIQCLKEIKHRNSLYCCDNRKLRDEDFPNELEKWNADIYLDKMDRMCYQSAYKMEDEKYDIGLFDEGDYMLTPEYVKTLENNAFKHKIFVSATLDEDKKEMLAEHIPIVYEKKLKDIDGKGIVNKAELYFVNYMLLPDENKKYLAYNDVFRKLLNANNLNRTSLDSVKRNRKHFLSGLKSSENVAKRLMKKLYVGNDRHKMLIFCGLSAQADKICKYSYHSNNDKDNEFLNMFDAGEIRLLSVVGKIDRGVNLEGVNVIIFESPAESKTKFIQKSGRGRRLHVDDVLKIFFLVPFYTDRKGEVKPTVVQKWVLSSTKDIDGQFKVYHL